MLTKDCLTGKTNDDHFAELSTMLGISLNRCKTLYDDISPIEFCDRPMDIGFYLQCQTETATTCHQCAKAIFNIRTNTNRPWKGNTLCDRCWSGCQEERNMLWSAIQSYKKVQCAICGSVKEHEGERYHYDHINMFEKNNSICSMVNEGCPIDEIYTEIDLCQILCLTCHHIVTDIENKSSFTRIKQILTRKLTNNEISEEDYENEKIKYNTLYIRKMKDIYETIKNDKIDLKPAATLQLKEEKEHMLFNSTDVATTYSVLCQYICGLNLFLKGNKKTSGDVLAYAREICSGLPSDLEMRAVLQKESNAKDKGLFGKVIELGLFGQKPNCDAAADLACGLDIKSCALKTLLNGNRNAKERQTLTNVGNTQDYTTFQAIADCVNFADCKYYTKSQRFLLVVRADDGVKNKTMDQLLATPVLAVVLCDMAQLPAPMRAIIDSDYAKIRACILAQKVSQKGQEYLHIHPHGAGHGSGHRALGLTNKFITQLVAHQIAETHEKTVEEVLERKGPSIAIKKEYFA